MHPLRGHASTAFRHGMNEPTNPSEATRCSLNSPFPIKRDPFLTIHNEDGSRNPRYPLRLSPFSTECRWLYNYFPAAYLDNFSSSLLTPNEQLHLRILEHTFSWHTNQSPATTLSDSDNISTTSSMDRNTPTTSRSSPEYRR